MSVAVITALGTTIGESTITAELLAVAPVALWGGALVAAAAAGQAFGKLWNKNRNEIPNIEKNIEAGQLKIQQTGANYLEPAIIDINANINQYLKSAEAVDKIFNSNYKEAIQKMADLIKRLNVETFDLYQTWITTLALLHVAGDDNTFYTLNKGKIDNLIGAYVSNPLEVDSLINAIQQLISGWNKLVSELLNWEDNVNAVIINTVIPTNSNFPTLPNLDLKTIIPTLDINALIAGTNVYTREQVDTISASISKTQNNNEKKKKKKRKRKRKLRAKRKKQKKKNPKQIIMIRVNVSKNSNWIRAMEFKFPTKKDIDSDDKGTLTFFLKKGGTIRKVRVNRGTFSTIVMWSFGSSLGVGYRYWSQFNKKAIVNRHIVLSWVLPRITKQDREIAIPLENKEKRVKYK